MTNSFLDYVKLIGYLTAAVVVELSKPCVGLSPKTKIFLFLPWKLTEELL